MVKGKSNKITKKYLKEQINAVEQNIVEKIKSGDTRGVNSLNKKLTKLKKEYYMSCRR